MDGLHAARSGACERSVEVHLGDVHVRFVENDEMRRVN
jgi:hypothetical protein